MPLLTCCNEKPMTDKTKKNYCYLDHANKKSENYAANPYLFWLKQVRRLRDKEAVEDDRFEDDNDVGDRRTG